MSSAARLGPIDVNDYLLGEQNASRKHEYVEGLIYAMVGASNNHNRIATNATVCLGTQLRGQTCEVFNSDTKVRIQTSRGIRFYYPDCMVVCEPNSGRDSFHDRPVVIVEVHSESTRRYDAVEKRNAYLTIPSLQYYLQVEPDLACVLIDAREGNEFQRTVQRALSAVIELTEINCTIPLNELYAQVRFPTPDEIREREEIYDQ